MRDATGGGIIEGRRAYVREARRLRARLAGGELMSQLGQLAGRYDVTAPDNAFAQNVAASLEGTLLRYSRRMELLREAQRRGIGRFEANVIIAAVQHSLRTHRPPNNHKLTRRV